MSRHGIPESFELFNGALATIMLKRKIPADGNRLMFTDNSGAGSIMVSPMCNFPRENTIAK